MTFMNVIEVSMKILLLNTGNNIANIPIVAFYSRSTELLNMWPALEYACNNMILYIQYENATERKATVKNDRKMKQLYGRCYEQ